MKLVMCKPNGTQVPITSSDDARELLAHIENEEPWCGNRAVELFCVEGETLYFRLRKLGA